MAYCLTLQLRLLWVSKSRTEPTVETYFTMFCICCNNGYLYLFDHSLIAATAIISIVGCDPADSSKACEMKKCTRNEILERTKEICDILQLEFIFVKPCQNLDALITDAIQSLQENDILMETQVSGTTAKQNI